MNEFELITTFFMHSSANGDDAAVVDTRPGHSLLTSIDTLIEGRHFRATDNAFDIGFKSLAVSISDLAAMGAEPTAFLLSLSLPRIDERWLMQFSQGLYDIANQYHMQHIGGDTTKGPLTISSVVFGQTPTEHILQRRGAQIGDAIYVSGLLGDAACALHDVSHDQTRLKRPQPRVELGMALRKIATSCIDISDGLAQDLGHILKASHVGATLLAENVPQHSSLALALTGGDDYELCFTAPKAQASRLKILSQQLNLPITCIGSITNTQQLEIIDAQNNLITIDREGYQHF